MASKDFIPIERKRGSKKIEPNKNWYITMTWGSYEEAKTFVNEACETSANTAKIKRSTPHKKYFPTEEAQTVTIKRPARQIIIPSILRKFTFSLKNKTPATTENIGVVAIIRELYVGDLVRCIP